MSFVSELAQAANEPNRLTMAERADLFRRAAVTLRIYDEIAESSSSTELVVFLEALSASDTMNMEEVSEAFLKAAEAIRVGGIYTDANYEII